MIIILIIILINTKYLFFIILIIVIDNNSTNQVTLFTLFRNERGPEIILWINYYYTIHHIDNFVLYYNGKYLPRQLKSYLKQVFYIV